MPTRPVHHGNNVKRIREILRIKQEVLADTMGVSQQKISLLEQKEQIDSQQLEEIAKALNIPADLIEHYDAEAGISIIANHFTNTSHDSSTFHSSAINSSCTFNPLDELLKAIEENKKLYQELLRVEREKVAMLEKMLNK
ncbi:helix-turn-helix transcriptional regulator [Paraflavitalea speifideaquila]|uniref:helix-turn-helix domain-containing protein n=1 Tax=Paraflavitalea speifideaquila TaxID=3076558 RepID=UPI0028E75CC9|nr:helix-turn-helix transcriptional regulator [Paraflavitalea speifideiaquila]